MPLTRLPLGTAVSGTLAATNGGTGVTSVDDIGNLVLLSTTTPTATRDIDISLPSGYESYLIIGREIVTNTASNEVDFYTTTDNFSSTDSSLESQRSYLRIDSAQSGTGNFDGYINLATNMGVNASDSCEFELTMINPTTTRTTGYSITGHSVYGHDGDAHHYRYDHGARSQTSTVVDGIRLRCNSSTTFIAKGSIKIYGLR